MLGGEGSMQLGPRGVIGVVPRGGRMGPSLFTSRPPFVDFFRSIILSFQTNDPPKFIAHYDVAPWLSAWPLWLAAQNPSPRPPPPAMAASRKLDLSDEVEGEQDATTDFFFHLAGDPIPILPTASSPLPLFDLQSPPARPLAVSDRHAAVFLAHPKGESPRITNQPSARLSIPVDLSSP